MILTVVSEMDAQVMALMAACGNLQADMIKEKKLMDKHHFSIASVNRRYSSMQETLQVQSGQSAELHVKSEQLKFQQMQRTERFSSICVLYRKQIQSLHKHLHDEERARKDAQARSCDMKVKMTSLEKDNMLLTVQVCELKETGDLLHSEALNKMSTLRCNIQKAGQQVVYLDGILSVDAPQLEAYLKTIEMQCLHLQETTTVLSESILDKLTFLSGLKVGFI
jgi:hypothetical protein